MRRDQAFHLPGGKTSVPNSPRGMPTGPSIATARVQHPLSSNESAALTQLRAELNALLAEAQNGPDLSLVPLPRQLNQAVIANPPSDATKPVRLTKPNRLQPRAAAAVLRRDPRRRYTADTAQPVHSLQTSCTQPGQDTQMLSHFEPAQLGMCPPVAPQHAESLPAEASRTADSEALKAAGVTASSTVQAVPKGKRYGRSNSWADGLAPSHSSPPTSLGVTQNGVASTSSSK